MKTRYVCQTCKSDRVEIENWNWFNPETQRWEYVSEAGDDWWCPVCETHAVDVDQEEFE